MTFTVPGNSNWPLWRRARNTRERTDTEYVALARYATSDALWGFDAPELPVGLPPHEIASRIYGDVFERMAWNYVVEVKRPAPLASVTSAQQIRTPRDIQRYRAATCLDASVLFAALAVRAGARPSLVIGRNHAFVLIGDHLGGVQSDAVGIARADAETLSRIDSGDAWAIDIVQALITSERPKSMTFDVALQEGRQQLANAAFEQSLVLIDVVEVNDRHSLAPFTPNDDPTFIPRSLPAHAGMLTLYKSQRELCERLRDTRGVVVIHGDSGSGKTTAALDLAAQREIGPAISLDATTGETIIASAAAVGARERGTSADSLAPQERDGDAQSLLARLSTSQEAWCVVFDNADGDPSQVLRWLPRPDASRGQTVIVTTTNATWFQLSLVDQYEALTPIDHEDVSRALQEHAELTDLVAGRAVTLRAFLRYVAGGKASTLMRHAEQLPDNELRGPTALVTAVVDERPELRAVLGRLTLLPPDHIPVCPTVADLDTFLRLRALGLVDVDTETNLARMHRLIGRAVRAVIGSEDEALAAADLISDDDSFAALSEAADPDLLARYTSVLLGAFAPDTTDESGARVLQRAASLMELRGRSRDSRDLAAPAASALSTTPGSEPLELADALQSLARWTNQHQPRNADALAEALEQMALAQRIASRHGDSQRAARARRLEGLLRVKVGWLNEDPEAGTSQIVSALQDLEREADLAELSDSGVDPGEAYRARFNVAGPRVTLAQRLPLQADGYLRAAQETYERVRKDREALYPQTQHPHIAACISGEALVSYMRANLVAKTYDEQQRLLTQATDLEHEALTDRFELEGPLGGADTGKSSRLLTKIAYARHRLNDTGVRSAVLDEARGEVDLPRLSPATNDLRAFAQRWLGSSQLAALLNVFTVTTPEALATVALERSVYDVLESRTVLTSSRALGLMDTQMPTRRVFAEIILQDADGRFAEQSAEFYDRLLGRGEIVVGLPGNHASSASGPLLLITPHIERVRQLATARQQEPDRDIDALGYEPTPGSAPFGPGDYLSELAATATSLRIWTSTDPSVMQI